VSGHAGRRAARLPTQGARLARKTPGIEGVLVDNVRMEIRSLETNDHRRITIAVAGPSALLVAKLHKLYDRAAANRRVSNKDSYDVLRLLRDIEPGILIDGVRRQLVQDVSRSSAKLGLDYLEELFGDPDSPGSVMAANSVSGLEDLETVRQSAAVLARDLLSALALKTGSDHL
jgi:hypothetical protein